ncbi:MAG: hypothetical protein WA985_09575 [Erythrobacter sp.]
MKDLTNRITKGALGTVAIGAMALATASPAMADDRYRDRDRDDGIGAGEIIAGAVILGGIAAIAGAFDNDDDDYYRDRRYRDRNYRDRRFRGYDANFNRRGIERAIGNCVRAAERQARRFGGYRYADVTDIRDVDRTRYGLRVKGRMRVEDSRRYRRRGSDSGRFTCYIDRGRPQVEFSGIRGLR